MANPQDDPRQDPSFAEMQLEAVFSSVIEGIVIINERGVIQLANQATAKLFGYALEELVGQNVRMLMPEPDHSRHDDYLRHYLQTGQKRIIGIGREVTARRKDGSTFPIRLSISETKQKGQLTFTGIITDLTEIKATEQALLYQKEKAEMYFDLANTMNVVLDLQACVVEVNNKAREFVGMPESELLGKPWFPLIFPPDRQREMQTEFEKMISGEAPLQPYLESACHDHHGHTHYIAWHNNFIRDRDGRISGLIASGANITKRVVAEHDLEREKMRAREYLNLASNIIVVLDKQGAINLLNRKGCEMLGLRQSEALGKNWFDLALVDGERERIRKLFADTVAQGKPFPEYFENTIRTQSGEERLVAWLNAAFYDENGQLEANISSGLDITEMRAAQERIHRLNAELEDRVESRTEELANAVNKLLNTNKQLKYEIQERKAAEKALRNSEKELREAIAKERELSELKSRFVSMASHEFRTPLSTILSSADLIEAYVAEAQQPKRERHTGRIKSAVNNLTSILNDFLSLSRLEEGRIEQQPELFDLETFCESVLDEVQGLLQKGQELRRDFRLDKREVYMDKRFLKNILLNLLSNAIKYSGEGDPIDCSLSMADGQLRLEIRDYGIGIPKEEQQHLFSRFFRAANVENIQGTGLGLNIVKRYVELMDGRISFQSQLEKGTVFVVFLPEATSENS